MLSDLGLTPAQALMLRHFAEHAIDAVDAAYGEQ
jgi:hypothetical protein